MPRLLPLLAAALALASPALAESQSSNASSNCSNGICTRSESLVIERDGRRQGWVREDAWRERGPGFGLGFWIGGEDRRAPSNRPRPRRDRDDDDN